MSRFNDPYKPTTSPKQFFAGFDGPQNLSQVLSSPEFRNYSQGQGLLRVGNRFRGVNAAGTPFFRSAESVANGFQQSAGGASFLDQFEEASLRDLEAAEGARIENREGINRALGRAEAAVETVGAGIGEASEKSAKDLEALALRQRAEFEERIGGELDRFESARADLESATSGAIHRTARNNIKSLEAGFLPDGRRVPPEQAAAFAAEARIDAANRATEQLASIGAQFAEGRLGAAVGISQQRVASQNLEADLFKQAAAMRAAVPAAVLRNELEGNLALAQFQAANPDSPLSIADTLAQIAALSSAPGSGLLRAVNGGNVFNG